MLHPTNIQSQNTQEWCVLVVKCFPWTQRKLTGSNHSCLANTQSSGGPLVRIHPSNCIFITSIYVFSVENTSSPVLSTNRMKCMFYVLESCLNLKYQQDKAYGMCIIIISSALLSQVIYFLHRKYKQSKAGCLARE